MIDLRFYRFALLAVPLAAVIAMFSLQSVPSPLSGGVPPDAFDPATAAPLAKELAASAAYPTPGSAADNAMAQQVKQHFSAIDGATVAEQRFGGTFRGHGVDMQNLIATLPGESDRQIALTIRNQKAFGHYHHAQYDVACIHALLGRTDRALEWLHDGAHNGFPCAAFFEQDPLLASIRDEPRFEALMRDLRAECDGYARLYRTLQGSQRA